jgi:hypothetical protein
MGRRDARLRVPILNDVAAMSRSDTVHDMARYGACRAATWCTLRCNMVRVNATDAKGAGRRSTRKWHDDHAQGHVNMVAKHVY